MPVTPRGADEGFSDRRTWPSYLIEMPRGFKITFADLEVAKRFKIDGNPNLVQLRDATRFDGPMGKKAKEALEYVKQLILALVRRSAQDPNKQIDNEDYVESKAPEVNSTRPHHYADRINFDFISLAGFLQFLDFKKACKHAPDPKEARKDLENSFERKTSMDWLKKFKAKYDRAEPETKVSAIPTVTLDELFELKYKSDVPAEVTLQSLALKLDIKANMPEADLREALARQLGFLSDAAPQGAIAGAGGN